MRDMRWEIEGVISSADHRVASKQLITCCVPVRFSGEFLIGMRGGINLIAYWCPFSTWLKQKWLYSEPASSGHPKGLLWMWIKEQNPQISVGYWLDKGSGGVFG